MWDRIKQATQGVTDIAKQLPGAARQVATEPFKNPGRTLESVAEGTLNAGPALVNSLSKTGAGALNAVGLRTFNGI